MKKTVFIIGAITGLLIGCEENTKPKVAIRQTNIDPKCIESPNTEPETWYRRDGTKFMTSFCIDGEWCSRVYSSSGDIVGCTKDLDLTH